MAVEASVLARLVFVMFALSFPLQGAAAADEFDELDKGPKVGMAIPHSLEAVDQHGQHQDFKSLARRRGLIILFNRSLDW